MATKQTSAIAKEELVEKDQLTELDLLKARLKELESRIGESQQEVEEEDDRVRPDEYILVMSLLPHTLNLSTKGGGQGSIKRFTKFGETKRILYRDLVDIVEAHPNFVEAGYIYILDARVVRQHGLDDIYSRILTKEKMDEIIGTKSEECLEIYKSATVQQKEIVLELLVDKLFNDPESVNLNIVDKISRDSGIDIAKRAEDRKAMMKLRESEDESEK